MIIILIGYMGSGKSTIGKKLSDLLNFECIDLDEYIQEKEQLSISEVFKSKGEIYFRKKEHAYLKEVLLRNNVILSLGGGTPCYGTNMDVILNAQNSQSIYLKCSIPNLVQRLMVGKSTRPLISHLQTEADLTEFIGKHLFERSFYYSQSNTTIVTDHKTVEAIAQEIMTSLF